MKKETVEEIFQKTKELYEKIAEQYSKSPGRSRPRLPLQERLRQVHGRVLDVGCGNGISSQEVPAGTEYTGVDVSSVFIDIAKKKFSDETFLFYDGRRLPFDDDTFDWVISIAVLHHVPGKDLQREILQEMKRVAKRGGKIFITVWDLWNMHFLKFFLMNVFKKIISRSALDFLDLEYPWKDTQGSNMGMRYFHMFTLSELTRLGNSVNLRVVEKGKLSFLSKKFKNYYVVFEK